MKAAAQLAYKEWGGGGGGCCVCARKSQPEKESLLAATKRWKYLLAGQTECEILLKPKRALRYTTQAAEGQEPVVVKPGLVLAWG